MVENNPNNTQSEQVQTQQTNRYFIIIILLLMGLLVGLFFLGPSIGIYPPCHNIIQPVPNATTPTI